MRIELDENVPVDLVAELSALGHDVEHVAARRAGMRDRDLWPVVQNEHRLLISQDVRFADARMIESSPHFGFVLLRLEQDETEIIARVREVFRTEPVETWRGCIVVITAKKVRVRRTATPE